MSQFMSSAVNPNTQQALQGMAGLQMDKEALAAQKAQFDAQLQQQKIAQQQALAEQQQERLSRERMQTQSMQQEFQLTQAQMAQQQSQFGQQMEFGKQQAEHGQAMDKAHLAIAEAERKFVEKQATYQKSLDILDRRIAMSDRETASKLSKMKLELERGQLEGMLRLKAAQLRVGLQGEEATATARQSARQLGDLQKTAVAHRDAGLKAAEEALNKYLQEGLATVKEEGGPMRAFGDTVDNVFGFTDERVEGKGVLKSDMVEASKRRLGEQAFGEILSKSMRPTLQKLLPATKAGEAEGLFKSLAPAVIGLGKAIETDDDNTIAAAKAKFDDQVGKLKDLGVSDSMLAGYFTTLGNGADQKYTEILGDGTGYHVTNRIMGDTMKYAALGAKYAGSKIVDISTSNLDGFYETMEDLARGYVTPDQFDAYVKSQFADPTVQEQIYKSARRLRPMDRAGLQTAMSEMEAAIQSRYADGMVDLSDFEVSSLNAIKEAYNSVLDMNDPFGLEPR